MGLALRPFQGNHRPAARGEAAVFGAANVP